MAKSGGMGDSLHVDGYDLGGDIGSVGRIGGGPALSDVTGIKKSAIERIGLQRDGGIDYTAWFNDENVATPLGAHQVLKMLPTVDRLVSYQHGSVLGGPIASLVSKQVNYDATRGQDGSLTFTVNSQANGFGLEWGEMLTAGVITHGAATNGTGIDYGSVSTSFGWAAYLHLEAFTGTSATFNVQDSADNVTFTTLSGGSFGALAAIGGARLAGASNATVRRYVRIQTTGTFTVATFIVNFVRYLTVQP